MELVLRRLEVLAGDLGDGFGHLHVEALGGVEAGAHGGTAQGQLLQLRQSDLEHLLVLLQTASPAGDLLGELNGGGVLKVGAAGFDHILILCLQATEGINQQIHCGDQLILDGSHGGNVHGRGERIVGGLGHVDVVVGMEQLLPCQLVAAVGNNLVGIHVGLGTGTGLPDHQREVLVELAAHDLIAGLGDDFQLLRRHLLRLQGMVGHGRRLLENAEGIGDLPRHGLNSHADLKVLMAALGLRRPVLVGWHLHFSHGVPLNTIFHLCSPFSSSVAAPGPRIRSRCCG